LHLPCKWFT